MLSWKSFVGASCSVFILEYIILNKQSDFEVYKLLLPVFNLVQAFLFEEMENEKK